MKPSQFCRMTRAVALLAVAALCPKLHAEWGSLRGSNRSGGTQGHARTETRPAARPQTETHGKESRPQPAAPPRQTQQPQEPAHQQTEHQRTEPAREQTHRVEGAHATPEVIDRARENEWNRQRLDIAQDRRQSYFWSDFHPGMRIHDLPRGYHRFHFRDHDYYYFSGLFYINEPSVGYVIIAPPVGAEVSDLPPGAEDVVANDTIYYYAAGAFYVQQPDSNFLVVAPPLGVTVTLLPPGAVQVIVNGISYYEADGAYYLPVMQNGVVVYLTVQRPQ